MALWGEQIFKLPEEVVPEQHMEQVMHGTGLPPLAHVSVNVSDMCTCGFGHLTSTMA